MMWRKRPSPPINLRKRSFTVALVCVDVCFFATANQPRMETPLVHICALPTSDARDVVLKDNIVRLLEIATKYRKVWATAGADSITCQRLTEFIQAAATSDSLRTAATALLHVAATGDVPVRICYKPHNGLTKPMVEKDRNVFKNRMRALAAFKFT